MQIAPVGDEIKKSTTKNKNNLSFYEATKVIYEVEGFKGYMRGFYPTMYKNFLAAGVYFSTLHYFEESMKTFQNLSVGK